MNISLPSGHFSCGFYLLLIRQQIRDNGGRYKRGRFQFDERGPVLDWKGPLRSL